MFEFAHPWVLALIPGLLGWWAWRATRPFSSLPQFLGDEGASGLALPSLAQILRMAVLLLLLLALAGPRSRSPLPFPAEEGIAMVIAIDLSGSMALEDQRGMSRLAMARAEITRFIRARPHDRIGLVTFGEGAITRVPPTTGHDHLLRVLDDLEVGSLDEGTALGMGLGLAAHAVLAVESPSRVVILLTDGRSNRGTIEPLSAAEAAGLLEVRIHAVGVGEPRGDDPLDEGLLRSIVGAGAGSYFRARDSRGLRDVLQAVDALETGPMPEMAGFSFESHHRWVLLLAACLFGLEAMVGILPWGRAQ